jgi:hypothetical protein
MVVNRAGLHGRKACVIETRPAKIGVWCAHTTGRSKPADAKLLTPSTDAIPSPIHGSNSPAEKAAASAQILHFILRICNAFKPHCITSVTLLSTAIFKSSCLRAWCGEAAITLAAAWTNTEVARVSHRWCPQCPCTIIDPAAVCNNNFAAIDHELLQSVVGHSFAVHPCGCILTVQSGLISKGVTLGPGKRRVST